MSNNFLGSTVSNSDISTETTQSAILNKLNAGLTISGSTTTTITDINIPAQTTTLSTTVSNFPATQNVDITAQTVGNLNVDIAGQTLANLQCQSNSANISTEATLSSVDGKLPATIGQKSKAGSLAVTLATDEDNVNVDVQSVPANQTVDITRVDGATLMSGDLPVAVNATVIETNSGNTTANTTRVVLVDDSDDIPINFNS